MRRIRKSIGMMVENKRDMKGNEAITSMEFTRHKVYRFL